MRFSFERRFRRRFSPALGAFFAILAGLFLSLVLVSSVSRAADAPAAFRVPELTGPVVDDAGVLNPQVTAALEAGLRKLHDQGGSQIQVLTVSSLGGLEIEQASIKVTDLWKLGGAKADNGVLLLVAPTEHRVRIEVGQGLEGQLTDASSNRIIRDIITPEFKKGDYDSGVVQGLAEILHYTDPNVDASALFNARQLNGQRAARPSHESGSGIPIWIFIVGFILLSLFMRGGGGRGGRISPWGAGALGYALGRGGGGWGGGGGGGGGWGGGGGGFSGGGASGGW